jgi:hypothetical protein
LTQVLADLAAGKLFIVIDALDEARLKVNESSFNSFLASVGPISVSSRPASSSGMPRCWTRSRFC